MGGLRVLLLKPWVKGAVTQVCEFQLLKPRVKGAVTQVCEFQGAVTQVCVLLLMKLWVKEVVTQVLWVLSKRSCDSGPVSFHWWNPGLMELLLRSVSLSCWNPDLNEVWFRCVRYCWWNPEIGVWPRSLSYIWVLISTVFWVFQTRKRDCAREDFRKRSWTTDIDDGGSWAQRSVVSVLVSW